MSRVLVNVSDLKKAIESYKEGDDFTTVLEELQRMENEIEIADDKIQIVWQVDDVLEKAKEDGVKITKEQAYEVLGLVERNHDCNYGITWDTISSWIDYVSTFKRLDETMKLQT
jgi:hypothetical protein